MSRRRRWIIAIITVLVLFPLVSAGVFAVWMWVAFSGGLDNALSFNPPRPGDRKVIAAEEKASGPFRQGVRDDTDRVVLPAIPGSAAMGSAELPSSCIEGQHDWKRDDPYDLVCDLTQIEAVSVSDRVGFRADMVGLDAALQEAGWLPGNYASMDKVLTQYWDELAEPWRPGATTPGTLTTATVTPGADPYSMDNLPGADYTRIVDGLRYRLSIDWAEQGSDEYALGYGLDGVKFRTPADADLAPRELLKEIPAGGYAVVLTHSVEYFHE